MESSGSGGADRVSDSELTARIYRIYGGSDGEATKALYAELDAIGVAGVVAVNLFRAQKASSRAKVYRGGGYRGMAYEKKQSSMDNLCGALTRSAAELGIVWGWGEDAKQEYHRHVLYIDLPTGQVSFHTAAPGAGPRYDGAWDGVPNASTGRILSWIIRLLSAREGGSAPAPTGYTRDAAAAES